MSVVRIISGISTERVPKRAENPEIRSSGAQMQKHRPRSGGKKVERAQVDPYPVRSWAFLKQKTMHVHRPSSHIW
jgi:hypothetical protein